jgi:hypothetical protein
MDLHLPNAVIERIVEAPAATVRSESSLRPQNASGQTFVCDTLMLATVRHTTLTPLPAENRHAAKELTAA